MNEFWLTAAWCLAVFLFFLSAFFSCSETALMRVNRLRLRTLADEGDRRAGVARRLLERPTQLLSGILLGNNFANVALASLATALAEPVWGELAPVYVAPILTILILLFAEILPKSFASRKSLTLTRLCAPALGWFIRLSHPFVRVISRFADLLVKPFVGRDSKDEEGVSAEDLVTLARVGLESGAIGGVTHDLMHGLYEFSRMRVMDVLVPRMDMVTMPLSGGIEAFKKLVRRHRHTRIPVWEENEENIVGVLHAKDLILSGERFEKAKTLRPFLHPAVFVPEQTPLGAVLRQIQASRTEMVFVVDEYGGLEGLATLRDVLEELTGRLADEHDRGGGGRLQKTAKNVILADANVTLRYLSRHTGITIHGKDAKTLGGLVACELEGDPEPGAHVLIDGIRFTVLSMDGPSLDRLRLEILEDEEADEDAK